MSNILEPRINQEGEKTSGLSRGQRAIRRIKMLTAGAVLLGTTTLTAGCGGGGSSAPVASVAPADTTPEALTLAAKTGVALSTVVESDPGIVSGITSPSAISITGGEYAKSTDAGVTWSAYTNSLGAISNGNWYKVRHTSSAINSTSTDSVLTIGGVSATFTITTEAVAADIIAPSKVSESFPNLDGGGFPYSGTITFDESVAQVISAVFIKQALVGDDGTINISGIGTNILTLSGIAPSAGGNNVYIQLVVQDSTGNQRTIVTNTYLIT